MPYRIAIASGKGGTGKTTVSLNLFHYLAEFVEQDIQLVDCDVEEPNDALFFSDIRKTKQNTIFQSIPKIDPARCNYCRKCAEYCEFNAIVIIPPARFAEVSESLCHSCGACLYACENQAISETGKSIGTINHYSTKEGSTLIEGRLDIGSAMQTMLIREMKKKVSDNRRITLYDAPPGTSCPVVETISDADFIILVTEPTPFGLHDLKLMVELLHDIQKPFGVLINKADLGNRDVYHFLQENDIELLGELPFMKEYATRYAMGYLLKDIPPIIEKGYIPIVEKMKQKLRMYEGNNHFKR